MTDHGNFNSAFDAQVNIIMREKQHEWLIPSFFRKLLVFLGLKTSDIQLIIHELVTITSYFNDDALRKQLETIRYLPVLYENKESLDRFIVAVVNYFYLIKDQTGDDKMEKKRDMLKLFNNEFSKSLLRYIIDKCGKKCTPNDFKQQLGTYYTNANNAPKYQPVKHNPATINISKSENNAAGVLAAPIIGTSSAVTSFGGPSIDQSKQKPPHEIIIIDPVPQPNPVETGRTNKNITTMISEQKAKLKKTKSYDELLYATEPTDIFGVAFLEMSVVGNGNCGCHALAIMLIQIVMANDTYADTLANYVGIIVSYDVLDKDNADISIMINNSNKLVDKIKTYATQITHKYDAYLIMDNSDSKWFELVQSIRHFFALVCYTIHYDNKHEEITPPEITAYELNADSTMQVTYTQVPNIPLLQYIIEYIYKDKTYLAYTDMLNVLNSLNFNIVSMQLGLITNTMNGNVEVEVNGNVEEYGQGEMYHMILKNNHFMPCEEQEPLQTWAELMIN